MQSVQSKSVYLITLFSLRSGRILSPFCTEYFDSHWLIGHLLLFIAIDTNLARARNTAEGCRTSHFLAFFSGEVHSNAMAQTKKNERQEGPSYKVSSYKGRRQTGQSRDSVEVVSLGNLLKNATCLRHQL